MFFARAGKALLTPGRFAGFFVALLKNPGTILHGSRVAKTHTRPWLGGWGIVMLKVRTSPRRIGLVVAISFWLGLAGAQTATSGGKAKEKIAVESLPRVSYRYGQNYRYGIIANQTSEGGAKKLTYATEGHTNMGVIKVDGKVVELGGPAGRWLAAPARRIPSQKYMTQATWVHGTIRVTQILDLVANPQPVRAKSGKLVRQLDRCLILYMCWKIPASRRATLACASRLTP
jgi:hypothetical protein